MISIRLSCFFVGCLVFLGFAFGCATNPRAAQPVPEPTMAQQPLKQPESVQESDPTPSPAVALEIPAIEQTSAAPTIVTFSNTGPSTIPRRACVLLIEADGVGYGDLSCYGQTKIQTPNLDRLAAGGVRFTNYVAGDGGVASQTAFLFGEDPKRVHRADETSVAEALTQAGYRTGFFGRWELGNENSDSAPWKEGFYEFLGYFDAADANNPYADYIFHYRPQTLYNKETRKYDTLIGREQLVPNGGGTKGEFVSDVLTRAGMNFIKNNRPDHVNHYRPFFLWLNYPIPGDGTIPSPSDAPYSDEPWPQPEKSRAALISRLDGYVGQLRAQLLKVGLTNNVAVLFTSRSIAKKANGVDPEFFHSQPATNDFRVPMILSLGWGDSVPANQVNGTEWSAQDVLPTVAEIGYAKAPSTANGKSVLQEIMRKRDKTAVEK